MSARLCSGLVLAGVAAGNLVATHQLMPGRVLLPLAGAAGWALLGARNSSVRQGAVWVSAFIVGAATGLMQPVPQESLARLSRLVPHCVAEGTVLESRKGLGTFGQLQELFCDGRRQPQGVVVFDGDQAFAGSRFVLEGQLVPLGRSEFDRARSMAGAAASMSGHARFAAPEDLWRAAARGLRRDLVDATSKLPAREGALLAGLTIGDTARITPSDEQMYRDTGLSHLVAVSGSNIAIVVGSVLLLLSRVRLWLRFAHRAGLFGSLRDRCGA